MKKLLASVVAGYCLFTTGYSQTKLPIRQPAIGISFTLTDFVTAQRIRTTSLASVFNNKKFAKFREMSPGIAISYFKGILPRIDFAATLNGSFLDYPFRNRAPFGNNHLLLEGDASANFKLVTEDYWVIPYATIGVGVHTYKGYYGGFVPLGVGLRVNLFDEAGINFTSQYRIPANYETSNYHFFHSIGIYGIIGQKKEEPKPLPPVPVVEALKDSDGDGITDDKDKCPTVPGVAKYDGCPVPDTDKDGINDDDDQCPTVAGVARYHGCPVPDSDKDGINDEEDKCPNVAGVARNQGCPEIKEEVRKKVDFAAQNILFASGSYKLLSSSNKGLNDVVKILQDNPELKLSIDGHTDNTGTPEKNQTLSENRANAVRDYLVSKGIDANRLTPAGHGQDQPIADNKTGTGRKKNRRVEMKLSY